MTPGDPVRCVEELIRTLCQARQVEGFQPMPETEAEADGHQEGGHAGGADDAIPRREGAGGLGLGHVDLLLVDHVLSVPRSCWIAW